VLVTYCGATVFWFFENYFFWKILNYFLKYFFYCFDVLILKIKKLGSTATRTQQLWTLPTIWPKTTLLLLGFNILNPLMTRQNIIFYFCLKVFFYKKIHVSFFSTRIISGWILLRPFTFKTRRLRQAQGSMQFQIFTKK
jgi:hypothetical protein